MWCDVMCVMWCDVMTPVLFSLQFLPLWLVVIFDLSINGLLTDHRTNQIHYFTSFVLSQHSHSHYHSQLQWYIYGIKEAFARRDHTLSCVLTFPAMYCTGWNQHTNHNRLRKCMHFLQNTPRQVCACVLWSFGLLLEWTSNELSLYLPFWYNTIGCWSFWPIKPNSQLCMLTMTIRGEQWWLQWESHLSSFISYEKCKHY